MVLLLKSRGKMKTDELARELEVKPRQVRNYKDELEKAGVYIDSETGKYGGYTLMNDSSIIGLNISIDEINLLEMGINQLCFNKYSFSSELIDILDKIKATMKIRESDSRRLNYFTKESLAYDEDQKQKVADINVAGILLKKIHIEYFSLKSKITGERIVHPYGLYQKKGDLYLAAYCEKRKKVIDFKVCRIKKYTLLDEKFEIKKDFTWKEYLKNCIGVYKDRNMQLKLHIKYPMSYIVAEKKWVHNQKVTFNEDDSIIFQAEMRGVTEVKSWILSMGSAVEIIEPAELREDIKEEIEKMKNKY